MHSEAFAGIRATSPAQVSRCHQLQRGGHMSHVQHIAGRYADIHKWQEDLRADLHRHPEVSMEEERTSQTIIDEVTALGLDATRVGPTGVVSVVANGDGQPVLARAHMDALPARP